MLPPNPSYGTTADLAALVAAAHTLGHKVMPYTNPTWWDVNGTTIRSWEAGGAALASFTALNSSMAPVWETYGPNSGVVSEPNLPRVQERIALLLHNLTATVGMDAIFEDQIGARPWLADYSPQSQLNSPSYLSGWVAHVTRSQAQGTILMTEQGFDTLANTEAAFCGSVLSQLVSSARRGPGEGCDRGCGSGLSEVASCV
jgi:hypothetical protein